MLQISKVSKLFLSLTIAALVSSTAIDPSQAKAKLVISKAGRAAGSISNTILSGKGTPAASLGINGDFYIDKTSLNLYGPKTNGKWNVPASLRGAVGPTGPSGLDGKDGAKGTSSTSGASGSTGASGLAGSTGPAGSIGPTGPSGPSGAAGLVGSVGPAGTNGTPGAKGDTGAAGSASQVRVIDISGAGNANPWIIKSSAAGEALSSPFGSLAANKSYEFTIIVSSFNTLRSFDACTLGSRVAVSLPGTAILKTTSAFGFGSIANSTSNLGWRFNFIHKGTIFTGANPTELTVSIIDGTGCTTGIFNSTTISVTGTAYITEVGSIG